MSEKEKRKEVDKMKKLKFIFGLMFLFLMIPLNMISPNGTAWNNGDGGSGQSTFADNSTNYNYDYHYGTHDWIAHAALNALVSDNIVRWQWLETRKWIYFVGTEAPDNSKVNMTLDGDVIEGFGDTTWHHVYFNQDGTISNNEDDSALRAKSMGDLANARINDGKYDQAAFYLGAMTHYIADLSMFAHVAENNVAPHFRDFDTHHSTIEGYVQTRTNDHTNMEEFFQISSFSIGSKKPYNSAKDLAWDTYNDSTNGYAHNAVWLHDNHFTGWVQTYAARSGDTQMHQDYYDRIETNLNNAISACASAMNYVLLHEDVPYTAPSDDDDDDDYDFVFESINGYNLLILSSSLIAIITISIMRKRVHKR